MSYCGIDTRSNVSKLNISCHHHQNDHLTSNIISLNAPIVIILVTNFKLLCIDHHLVQPLNTQTNAINLIHNEDESLDIHFIQLPNGQGQTTVQKTETTHYHIKYISIIPQNICMYMCIKYIYSQYTYYII